MLKMLAFVDVIAVPAANGVTVLPLVNLGTLLDLHGALSNALTEVRLLLHSPSSAQVETIHAEIVSLMSEKEAKAGEAIWSMMENYRTRVLESIDGGDDDSLTYVFGCW